MAGKFGIESRGLVSQEGAEGSSIPETRAKLEGGGSVSIDPKVLNRVSRRNTYATEFQLMVERERHPAIFACGDYKGHMWWYCIVDCVYQVMLGGILVFCGQADEWAPAVGILMSMLSLITVESLRPYVHRSNRTTRIASDSALYLKFLALYWAAAGMRSDSWARTLVGVLLIGADLCVMGIMGLHIHRRHEMDKKMHRFGGESKTRLGMLVAQDGSMLDFRRLSNQSVSSIASKLKGSRDSFALDKLDNFDASVHEVSAAVQHHTLQAEADR
jgi:hypothetical protein